MTRRFARISLLLAAISTMAVAASAPQVVAQTQIMGGPSQVVRMPLGAGQAQSLSIPRGTSAKVEFGNSQVRTAVVSDPNIVDVQPLTAGGFIVIAKTPGRTDIRYLDGYGREILTQNVRVEMDISSLGATLTRIAPSARVQAEAIGENILLSGTVANAAESDLVVRVARTYVSKPENVVNTLSLTGKDQVMVKATIVEVQTTRLKQFGLDLNTILNVVSGGGANLTVGNTNSFTTNGGYQGGSSFALSFPQSGATSGTATLRNFEREGLMSIIAEPTAVAVSGEAAKFHAGGKFPVPTSKDAQGNVILDFKEYGVGLGFTPVVLSGGRISIKVSTEVSDLTSQGAFTLTGNAGANTAITIPGLISRSSETTIEMPSGGSQMISGLILDNNRQSIDKVPGLGDLPFVGGLARSRDYTSTQTELVIIMTAYLVDPTNPKSMQTPADGLVLANDFETLFLGRLNKNYQTPATALAGRRYQGPFGHVIE